MNGLRSILTAVCPASLQSFKMYEVRGYHSQSASQLNNFDNGICKSLIFTRQSYSRIVKLKHNGSEYQLRFTHLAIKISMWSTTSPVIILEASRFIMGTYSPGCIRPLSRFFFWHYLVIHTASNNVGNLHSCLWGDITGKMG